MKLDFFDDFKDPYMKSDTGKGVFLAGIVLGMLAIGQVEKNTSIDSAPMFKQLNFGKLQLRDIKRHLSRIPELARVYNIGYAGMLESLSAAASKLMLQEGSKEPGVDGNFAFTTAFLNARDYFWGRIFKKQEKESEDA